MIFNRFLLIFILRLIGVLVSLDISVVTYFGCLWFSTPDVHLPHLIDGKRFPNGVAGDPLSPRVACLNNPLFLHVPL